MAKMNERVQEMFKNSKKVVLATSTPDGLPNAAPINAVKVLDDETLLISDQFFKKTLENLKANPKVAVTAWEGVEAYQVKGTVTLETFGDRFEETAKWIEDKGKKMGFPLKSKGAVIVSVTEVFNSTPGPDAGSKIA